MFDWIKRNESSEYVHSYYYLTDNFLIKNWREVDLSFMKLFFKERSFKILKKEILIQGRQSGEEKYDVNVLKIILEYMKGKRYEMIVQLDLDEYSYVYGDLKVLSDDDNGHYSVLAKNAISDFLQYIYDTILKKRLTMSYVVQKKLSKAAGYEFEAHPSNPINRHIAEYAGLKIPESPKSPRGGRSKTIRKRRVL